MVRQTRDHHQSSLVVPTVSKSEEGASDQEQACHFLTPKDFKNTFSLLWSLFLSYLEGNVSQI